MRRVASLLVALSLVAASCGGDGGSGGDAAAGEDEKTARTSLDGRPLKAGEDWNGEGSPPGEAEGGTRRSGAGEGEAASEEAAGTETSVPYGCNGNEGDEPPPQLSNPLGGTPENDFVMKATLTPPRADVGAELTIDVLAVGQAHALAVIQTSFYDNEDHGMSAAKFTDTAGKALFKGPIPADAPVGWATVAVTVTTEDAHSAIDTVNFVVTGEGCE